MKQSKWNKKKNRINSMGFWILGCRLVVAGGLKETK